MDVAASIRERASLCLPAILHLVLVEMIMLPLFQFAVFMFLRDSMVDIAILGRGGECGVCESATNRGCIVAKYRVFLMSLGLVRPSCNDGGWVDWAGWVPLGLNWVSLSLVAWIWFGVVIRFLIKIPLKTPMGSGHYLKFLWQTRVSRWYTISCRVLEVLAVLAIFALFAAAFAYMGTESLVWAFREKLIEGLFVIISMRQFTRPVLPSFNFAIEDFERIRFKLGIIFNSNAIVHELQADFCRAFADGVSVVEDADEGAIHSMLKTSTASNNKKSRVAAGSGRPGHAWTAESEVKAESS